MPPPPFFTTVLYGCFVLALAATRVAAQSISPCPLTSRLRADAGTILLRGPYTASVKISFEQHLVDGGVVHQTAEVLQARDAAGRMLRESAIGCDLQKNGDPAPRFETRVTDPKAHMSTVWTRGPRSTHLAFREPNVQQQHSPPLEAFMRRPAPGTQEPPEDLGTRIIAGVDTTGTRSTTLLPANVEGNTRPIKIVRESWVSTDGRIQLMESIDDPRFGKRSWEVTRLSLRDPEPSVFAPPPGYTITYGGRLLTPVLPDAEKEGR